MTWTMPGWVIELAGAEPAKAGRETETSASDRSSAPLAKAIATFC